MVKGYCSMCKSEKEGTGSKGRNCPTCGSLLGSLDKHNQKQPPKGDFSTGLPGGITLQPEESAKVKELMQKGIISNPQDVYKVGLLNLSSQYLPQGQMSGQGNVDSMDKYIESMSTLAQQKMKQDLALRMQKMAMGDETEKQKDNGFTLSPKLMMDMMMLNMMKDSLSGNKGNDSKDFQIQQMQRQMDQQQQQNQFNQMMFQFQNKGQSENDMFSKMMNFNQYRDQQEAQNRQALEQLRSENFQTQMQFLRDQVDNMGKQRGWGSELNEAIQQQMGQQFMEYFKTGKFASPEKSGMDNVKEFLGIISPSIQGLAQAYMSNKQQAQSTPQYYPASPMPAQPAQQPYDTQNITPMPDEKHGQPVDPQSQPQSTSIDVPTEKNMWDDLKDKFGQKDPLSGP